MKKRVTFTAISILLVSCLLSTSGLAAYSAGSAPGISTGPEQIQNNLYQLQLPFIQNQGQIADASVRYYAQTFAGTVFCTNDGIGYVLTSETGVLAQGVRETFISAKGGSVTGETPVATQINYFMGDDLAAWQKGVAAYQSVNYGTIYDYISLSLKAYGNNVEKVFHVSPGGDPAQIKLRVDGADQLSVNDQGQLVYQTGARSMNMTKPVAYQEIAGNHVDVPVAYQVEGNTYGFTLGSYDRNQELIIDPLLASTLIGGSFGWGSVTHNQEQSNNIKVRGDSVYVVAGGCLDFPITIGTAPSNIDPVTGKPYDQQNNVLGLVIFKMDKNLTTLQASTFVGGSQGAKYSGIGSFDFDAQGNLVLAGATKASDFPFTPGAYYHPRITEYNGSVYNTFVMKMSSDLNNITASSLFNGGGSRMALAKDGSIYLFGATYQTDSPLTSILHDPAANIYYTMADIDYSTVAGDVYSTVTGDVYNTVAGSANCITLHPHYNNDYQKIYVAKMSADLTALEAATYVGYGNPSGKILIDPQGDIIIGGDTPYGNNSKYPITAGAFQSDKSSTQSTVFVSKLSPDLKELKASTFLGGSTYDVSQDMMLDAYGNIYIAGYTGSPDFPVPAGAYDTECTKNQIGHYDGFIARLNNDLTNLTAATYLGTDDTYDRIYGMALDSAGNVFVTGGTTIPGSYDGKLFPVTKGAFRTDPGGGCGFISKLSSDLTQLEASTYTGWANGTVLAVDGNEIYMAGMAEAPYQPYVAVADKDYPSTDPAMDYPVITNGTAGHYFYPRIDGIFDYPVTTGAYQKVLKGGEDICISKFDLNLSADSDAPSLQNVQLETTELQSTELTLQWSQPEDTCGNNNSSISRYRVYKGWEPIANVPAGTTSLKVTGLTQGQDYTLRVEAQNAAGKWSTDGPSLTAKTLAADDTEPPYWPAGQAKMYVTELKPNSISLRWEPAQDKVGIKEYRICRPASPDWQTDGKMLQIATVPGDQLTYDATYLENGVQYGFIVKAVDFGYNVSKDYPVCSDYPKCVIGTYYTNTATLDYYGAYLTTVAQDSSTTGAKVTGLKTVPVHPIIKLAFNQDLIADNVWAANQACVKLLDSNGNEVPADVTRLAAESANIFVTPKGDLTRGKSYKIVMDTNLTATHMLYSNDGKVSTYYSLGVNKEIPFTVIGEGVSAGPAITFLSPTFGGTVNPAGTINVGFSSPIVPGSVNALDILLQRLGDIGTSAGGVNIGFNQFNTVLTITPKTNLIYGGNYQLILPGNLAGTDGSLAEGNHTLEFYTQTCQVGGDAALTLNGQVATAVVPGQTYHFVAAVGNKSDQSQSVNIYAVARGGKGARLDHGGQVLGFSKQSVTINSQAGADVPFDFTLPADITAGNVYVDIFVWNNNGQYRAAEPAHFEYQVTD